MSCKAYHFVADHFSPVMTGQPPWSDLESKVPSVLRLQNATADPFLGRTDSPFIPHSEKPLSLVCPTGTFTLGNTWAPTPESHGVYMLEVSMCEIAIWGPRFGVGIGRFGESNSFRIPCGDTPIPCSKLEHTKQNMQNENVPFHPPIPRR